MRFFPWMSSPLMEGAGDGNGGGGGTPPVFDAGKFKAELLGDVKMLFGEFAAQFKPKSDPPPPKKDDPPPPKKDGDHDQAALLARINELEAQRAKDAADAKAAREASRDRDRLAQVRTHLSAHQFASDSAAEDALSYFGSKLKFNDQDQLITPDGKPVKEWIAATLQNDRPYLLKPRDVGGAGAANGGGGAAGGRNLDLDDIKPGMSAEAMMAFEAQLSQMMRRQ